MKIYRCDECKGEPCTLTVEADCTTPNTCPYGWPAGKSDPCGWVLVTEEDGE